MFFDSFAGLGRMVLISVLAYGALILVLRLAGKRSLAKLNAFDLVVTVALGSTLATVVLSKDVPLLEGILAFAMLAALQWAVARLSLASPGFRTAVRNRPCLLLEDGAFRWKAMQSERVTKGEVEAAIRNAGIGQVGKVAAVVLETDGSMSVIRKDGESPDLLSDVGR